MKGSSKTQMLRTGDFGKFVAFLRERGWYDDAVAIATKFSTRIEDIYLQKRGMNHVVKARTELVCMLRERLPKSWSLPAIGEIMGRDHTTIMYMIEQAPKPDRLAEKARALVRQMPRCFTPRCGAPATHGIAPFEPAKYCGVHALPNNPVTPQGQALLELIAVLGEEAFSACG